MGSNLLPPLTAFVGRTVEMEDLAVTLSENRLVTLAGAGGCGKSRLAVELGLSLQADRIEEVWLCDLAPLTDGDQVLSTIAAVLGVLEEPSVPLEETVLRHLGRRRTMLILDNCEHLIVGVERALRVLLREAQTTILATSREPIGVDGEVVVRVPSLSVPDSVALFMDRARRARHDFGSAARDGALIAQICERLDGMPLAIELAAARVRVLSTTEIASGLGDRFQLLTGGARGGLRRQQTLRASVDWSHTLLTEQEQMLFRRLGVFAGAFDLAAAEAVGSGSGSEGREVLDQLTSLVDKSLVIVDQHEGAARYRLLETMRQYALERLGDSDEGGDTRRRHRDHYLSRALVAFGDGVGATEALADDLDNLRVALRWTLAIGEREMALAFAASLFGLWFPKRMSEGRRWLDEALEAAPDADDGARGMALGVSAWLEAFTLGPTARARAEEALAIARRGDDPGRIALALVVLGLALFHDSGAATGGLTEIFELAKDATERARSVEARLTEALALMLQGAALCVIDPLAARTLVEESAPIHAEVGNDFGFAMCRCLVAELCLYTGDLGEAIELAVPLRADSEAAEDATSAAYAKSILAWALSLMGDPASGHALAGEALGVPDFMRAVETMAHSAHALAYLAENDLDGARSSLLAGSRPSGVEFERAPAFFFLSGLLAEIEIETGNIEKAREIVAADLNRPGWRDVRLRYAGVEAAAARVALIDGDVDRAEALAQTSLATRVEIGDKLGIIDCLELLATIDAACENGERVARLLGAVVAARARLRCPTLAAFRGRFEAAVDAARASTDPASFAAAWSDGESLTLDDAATWIRRGRGSRGRPTTGWAALTPTEREVARHIADGIDNAAIAERMFVSTRTVNSHLTRIYRKLGVTSRVQLAREAAVRST